MFVCVSVCVCVTCLDFLGCARVCEKVPLSDIHSHLMVVICGDVDTLTQHL